MAEYSKKRNTYFLYDVLVRKYVKSLAEGNVISKVAFNMIQEYFQKDCVLGRERRVFEQILDLGNYTDLTNDEKLVALRSCKEKYSALESGKIFEEQTRLLNKMSFVFDKTYLNERVENYRLFANIWQYLNSDHAAESIVLEKKILEEVGKKEEQKEERKVVEKPSFLLECQEKVISLYESDNPGLYIYLNDQIKFMKEVLLEHSVCSECEVCDVEMKSGIIKIYHRLEEFRKEGALSEGVSQKDIQLILKVQDLVEDLKKKSGAGK